MRAEEQGASSGRRMVLAMKDAPRSAVLGSALYFFMLHGDAKRFLARHRKALAGLPVALFALGPFSDTPEDLASARGRSTSTWPRRSGSRRHRSRCSAGVTTRPRCAFPDNNPAMRNMPASDARGWEAIRGWADALPQALGVAAS